MKGYIFMFDSCHTIYGRLAHPVNVITDLQIKQWFSDSNRSLRLGIPNDESIAELRVYLNRLINEIRPASSILNATIKRNDSIYHKLQVRSLRQPSWHTHALRICELAREAWGSAGRWPRDPGPNSPLGLFTAEALNMVRHARGEPELSGDRISRVLQELKLPRLQEGRGLSKELEGQATSF
jgi:hypothetical protein